MTRPNSRAWLLLLLMWPLIGVLSACERQRAKPATPNIDNSILYVNTDGKTGCEYIARSSGGITPRIAADGKTHMGCTNTGAKHENE